MSKFFIGVSAGVANVYPYGQGSDVTKALKAGEALLCQVPVGDHVEPHKAADTQIAQSTKDTAKQLAEEDMAAPAAGVALNAPHGERTGTLLVAVTEGEVTLRTYAGSDFSEQQLEKGASASVEVTESNAVTLAVYDAQPKVDPRR